MKTSLSNDERFMLRALELADSQLGDVSPNPSVGAVIVKDGKIIAEGVTQKPGSDHAEIVALKKCSDARGATLYVTLEPCSHTNKRTPPCTDTIIKAGIKKVVVGVVDENPSVHGNGIKKLKEAGVDVTAGILEEEARRMHEFFFHWIKTKKPFVTLKCAMTMDGKMTWGDGKGKQVTGKAAQRHAHELRKTHDAVLVGVGTIIKDDPRLTCRLAKGRNPIRVVLDSTLRVPSNARVFDEDGKTLVFCTKNPEKKKKELLEKKCEVIVAKETDGRVDIDDVLRLLGKRDVTSVLVEGGIEVAAAFLSEKKVNKACFFVAPFERPDGIGFFTRLKEKDLRLMDICAYHYGEDIMIGGIYD